MQKNIYRTISIVLTVLMVVTILPINSLKATAATIDYATGDIITFGTYPQTKVTNGILIAALNSCTLSADNTVILGDTKYKRVLFTQYTPKLTTLPSTPENSLQDDNGYGVNTIHWFKFEPIKWIVLSNIDGEVLVLSEMILDSRAYNQDYSSTTWEISSMRAWLNTSFYTDAFSITKKSKIITSYIENEDSPVNSIDGGVNTYDKIFFLSYADTINPAYSFSSSYSTFDTARQTQGTDYAKSQGLEIYTRNPYNGNSGWFLRTPGGESNKISNVSITGYVSCNALDVNSTFFGVRPAMRLNKSLLILSTVENSGCVINDDIGFIYGIESGTTKNQFESKYINLSSTAKIIYTPNTETLGTDIVIEVVDSITNEVFESYILAIRGDINGDGQIRVIDALMALQNASGLISLNEVKSFAGDVNNSGSLNVIDALQILQYASGLITEF